MSVDIADKLLNASKREEFAIQIHEATDVYKDDNFIRYVRFVKET